MNNKDIQVIEKVAKDPSAYTWHILTTDNPYYKAVAFPIEAERPVNSFYTEILNGIKIVVGAYLSRFYYEEDQYAWEQKYYSAIIYASGNIVSSIAFVTSEEIARQNAHRIFGKAKINWLPPEENVIMKLYDFANRETVKIDDLYTKFLEGE